MIKRFLIIVTIIGLLASCPDPANNHPNNKPVNPENPNKKTTIVFDNTQGICAVSVYDNYQRREEDKIAEVSAGRLSEEIEYAPGDSVPFYFLYKVNLKGVSGFTLDYVPKEIGKDQTRVRIDAYTKNNIPIPKLDETVSSPDTLLSDKSYLLIQNNSSFSFQLHRGTSIITPDDSSATLVNSGERPRYTINPGAVSPYQLLVGADYVAFSGSIGSFEAGRVYSFVFDGAVSLVKEVEIILENVAGIPQGSSSPDIPGAPSVTASDGLLTLRWIAVQGAESYEVYYGTEQQPPATPAKTVAGTTTVLTELTNKTAYYIWIKAVNGSGSSDFSQQVRGIPWPKNEKPAVPKRPVIIPGINQLTVNWEECGGAASYEVYINATPTSPSMPEITTDKTSAVIKNLENDKIYYIWVKSVNGAGKSDYSPLEAGTPTIPTVAPTAPVKPVLTPDNQKLNVSWQAVELTAFYEVWFGTSGNSAEAQKYGGDISGDITETVITGLENETVYYVWIKAKNIVGTSGFSLPANAKPSAFAVLPETPSVPVVTAGNRELSVTWQSVEGALSYEVWTGTTNNSASVQKYGADVSGNSVTLTGLANGTTYYIWVKAKNNVGVSDLSPMASGTPSAFAATPVAPQTAPTVIAGSGQLTVSWQTVEGANSYEVWAGTDTNPVYATRRGGDITGLSSVITGLTNGTAYYVWIKAKNSVGTSNFSPMAAGTPSVFSVTPQAPAAPSVSTGNGQMTVTWTAVEGATAYEVWTGMANNSTSAAKNGADVSSALSATIIGLTNGTTYYIWIKAKNNIGTSGFGPVAIGKPIANATVPTLSASSGQLSVTWAAIAGADQYEVFCGTGINPPQTAAQTVTDTSATIGSLVNGTTYNVWVRGKNSTGTGTISPMASGTPIGNIGTVTLVSGNGQLTANWTAAVGADQYEVYYSTSNSIPGSPAQTVSTTTATISGLTNGTTYYVWVKGKNTSGTGGANTAVNGKPIAVPGAPILSPAYKQLLVTWTAVAGADEYEVYYGTNSTPTTLVKTIAGTQTAITGLTSGTTYYVRLRAKNTNGVSDYGPSASNIPNNVVPAPGLYRGAVKIGNQNLADSLTYISSNAVSGDDFYIVLGADENSSPKILNYSSKTVGITLLGYGGERIITLSANGRMFTVNSGVTLTLDENITLTGRTTNNNSLIYVSENGKLMMNDTTKITGNKYSSSSSSYSYGGGVRVAGNGIFTMNGGEISDNTVSSSSFYYSASGGGVYVDSNGTFTMNGGKISGNTTSSSSTPSYGGGVYVDRNGNFMMNGGEISDNTTSTSSSYTTSGGGVYVDSNGTFTISDGKISGNTSYSGGGVEVHDGTFTMEGGEISGNTSSGGGGVEVSYGTFTMEGGEISGNTSSVGGGAAVFYATFTMSGGKISGNTSYHGGGVSMFDTAFTMNGGEISGNTLSPSSSTSIGGGVEVSGGTFTMNGGKISRNTTSSSRGGNGGGVYVDNNGTFTMKGGEISGNTCSSFGGGVYVNSGTFTKSGGGTVTGYASDTVNGNVVKNASGVVQSNQGHAVYGYSSSQEKRRETTAGPTVNLNSSVTGSAGGWE